MEEEEDLTPETLLKGANTSLLFYAPRWLQTTDLNQLKFNPEPRDRRERSARLLPCPRLSFFPSVTLSFRAFVFFFCHPRFRIARIYRSIIPKSHLLLHTLNYTCTNKRWDKNIETVPLSVSIQCTRIESNIFLLLDYQTYRNFS